MAESGRDARLYAGLPLLREARTWAEIHIDALCHNYRAVCAHLKREGGETPVICVVKADAYGHGAGSVARALIDEGCRFFAVSCIEEGEELRGVCRRMGVDVEILILGYTRPALAERLAKLDLITTLVSAEYAYALAECAREAGVTVRAHAALDTGMNRVGLPARNEDEVETAVRDIATLMDEEGLALEGMFTHFARADEESGPLPEGMTERQLTRFLAVREALAAGGIRLFCHACNSAATIRFSARAALDAVRVGISLYGCDPSEQVILNDLLPVMRLVTLVSHIHDLPAGETVSYGGIYRAETPRRVATLPIGYADGFIRQYSGASVRISTPEGEVLAPIIGRICMDQCMVDVTDLPVSVGDRVTLFGLDPDDIRDLARRGGTIPYEVLCLISARVPRRYI